MRKIICFSAIVYLAFLSIIVSTKIGVAAELVPNPPMNLNISSDTTPPYPSPLPPPPTGNEGLLAGMTPSNYSIPSGWTLIRTQDFERSLPGDEWTGGDIVTERAHTGGRSVKGRYAGDGHSVQWILNKNAVGSYTDIYVSMWEYMESQARLNDELHTIRIEKREGDSLVQQIVFDAYHGTMPGWNTTDGRISGVCEGGYSGSGAQWKSYYGPIVPWGMGHWVQWEAWIRPNTPGNSDGVFRVYQNGALKYNVTNANLNGTITMTGIQVEVGGVYTKHIWYMDYPNNTICSSAAGEGGGYARWNDWSKPCPCPNQCPPSGYTPMFYRYFDDIIVMKR